MKIVINKINNEYLETVDSENLEYIFKFFKKFSSILSKFNKEKISKYLLLVFSKTISIELNLRIVFY